MRPPGDNPLCEAALREAVLLGDERAWNALHESAFDGLYAFVYYRSGRDQARAEDLAQECWLVAVRRIGDFNPDRGSFAAWLRGIAQNVLRNDRRSVARAPRKCRADEVADQRPMPGQQMEVTEAVGLALAGLPGHYRDVLTAKYEQRLSIAQIAQRSGSTPRAVDSLLSRAKAAFREAFARLGGEREDNSIATDE